MPDEWKKRLMLIYQSKGGIKKCTNYLVIKLLSHRLILWNGMTEQNKDTTLYQRKINNGTLYILRRSIERYAKKKWDLHVVLSDLEKTYDKILGEVIWHIVEKNHVHK